ncbi:mannose-1-phosphate guanylyltransferase/mannose-6-phosphate isomerase [Roseovarius halotolerans]|uniref:mannose-1-phosphate guanylyltransferase n=1 Tax=Roseovarius halotolerans TaxID=505353 RepID=A0A1X6ZWU9_9RHOB|nr:mannose-1-phosphate guanylyltransferase/mannose-6-phosphate isomerase [Roseovarius halotolerans]RKT32128.1 mannose-1-phosphate guanylyltransferase/mannose-6-phosphate isomerase [Roseovarius halotolerans]SLN64000.1 Alginate biosynthesis protein AlgA [Roseovarius halotolerans]
MQTITPVILCGGSGTRLWPLSRKGYPKQFARILGDESLLQGCAKRLSGQGAGLSFAAPVVLTNADFRFMVAEQMLEAGVEPGAVLIEPEARNTAPAVLAAALHVAASDPDALMLVAPSDHVIPDTGAFHAAIAAGAEAAASGQMVTFGITPTHPETGYGYLELGEAPDGSGRAVALRRFVEKPDADVARDMLEAGNFLWNAGIFLFAARDVIAAFEAHAPELMAPVRDAVKKARPDLGFLRLDPEAWAKAESISIDFAVMERAGNLSVVPYAHHWSDLGSWAAVSQEAGSDENGVCLSGPATAIDCENTLLRSESEGLEVVGLGLSNTMVVATPDAVLVADMSRTQDVGQVVKTLRAKGVSQADSFARDHRPWGYFETLALSERFQVKRIVVKPGAALSLQSHVHRAEHWIVVSGTARVTIGDEVKLVSENESVYVPLGAVHRMENPGKVPMALIEVQTGSYLGEDDIIRYEDVYARENDG